MRGSVSLCTALRLLGVDDGSGNFAATSERTGGGAEVRYIGSATGDSDGTGSVEEVRTDDGIGYPVPQGLSQVYLHDSHRTIRRRGRRRISTSTMRNWTSCSRG